MGVEHLRVMIEKTFFLLVLVRILVVPTVNDSWLLLIVGTPRRHWAYFHFLFCIFEAVSVFFFILSFHSTDKFSLFGHLFCLKLYKLFIFNFFGDPYSFRSCLIFRYHLHRVSYAQTIWLWVMQLPDVIAISFLWLHRFLCFTFKIRYFLWAQWALLPTKRQHFGLQYLWCKPNFNFLRPHKLVLINRLSLDFVDYHIAILILHFWVNTPPFLRTVILFLRHIGRWPHMLLQIETEDHRLTLSLGI